MSGSGSARRWSARCPTGAAGGGRWDRRHPRVSQPVRTPATRPREEPACGLSVNTPESGGEPTDGDVLDVASINVGADERRSRHRWSRRAVALTTSGLLLLVLMAVAALLPVPYVRLSPGPTFNTIGTHDGTPLIKISGTPTFDVSGSLDMTTVSELGGPGGGLTMGQALVAWVDNAAAVVPRELIFPDDTTPEQVAKDNEVAFSTSQSDAVGAALTYLDRPVDTVVTVASVAAESPADNRLKPGDRVVALDGEAVRTPADVGRIVRSGPVGRTVVFTVARDGSRIDVPVVTASSGDDPSQPYVGVSVGTLYVAPFTIDFTLSDVGGPSAGLMFSLGIIDKLTPGQLNGGRDVAGTGTIAPNGAVGPIGGIRQKLVGARSAGAQLFLAPAANCAEVVGHVPDGLTVVGVKDLAAAVDALKAWTTGSTPLPGCG